MTERRIGIITRGAGLLLALALLAPAARAADAPPAAAADAEAVSRDLVIQSLVDDEQYGLPMPNELLFACVKGNLAVDNPEALRIFRLDLEAMAKVNQMEACFLVGRMFSVIGFRFEHISNRNLLRISEKIYAGVRLLSLPAPIRARLDAQYRSFAAKETLERNEMILLFTEYRASLISLLQDAKNVGDADREMAQLMALCVEMGLWYQGLSMTLEAAEGPEKLGAVAAIFLSRDVTDYFARTLDKVKDRHGQYILVQLLGRLNDRARACMADGRLDAGEAAQFRQALAEVIF